MNKLILTAAAALALAACGPQYDYGYGTSSSSTAPASQQQSYPSQASPSTYPSASYSPTFTCISEEVAPSGALGKDIVGSWQDWGGSSALNATDTLTIFAADGTVTISSFPLDPYSLPDESKPMKLEYTGHYDVADGRLTISWSDGVTETSPAALSIVNVPGCTMLVLAPNKKSRLPNVDQLERVTCPTPEAAPATPPGIVK